MKKTKYLCAGRIEAIGEPTKKALILIISSKYPTRICVGEYTERHLTLDFKFIYQVCTLDGNMFLVYENEDTKEIKFQSTKCFIWRPNYSTGVDIYEVIE